LWVWFGFCVARDQYEESQLGVLYRELIQTCTFNEFVTAFESSTLFALVTSKGMRERFLDPLRNFDLEGLKDVLSLSGSPRELTSVWYLKQYIMTEEEVDLAAAVDYGFVNCDHEEDTSSLKRLYKQIFEMHRVKPLELHQAAIKGQLFKYAGSLVKLEKRKNKFQRLMKNPYPRQEI
jgi:hypothetical protein